MNEFDKIKLMNIDEFAEWLNENIVADDVPWINWWDKNYCNNCIAERLYSPVFGREAEWAWCELHGKCKFFENLDNIPDNKQIIKLWLESKS